MSFTQIQDRHNMAESLGFDYAEEGQAPYSVRCYPPPPKRSWSSDNLRRRIEELQNYGVHTLYHPDTHLANGKLVPKKQLKSQKKIGGITVHFDDSIRTEGVYSLQSGEGMYFYTAGCSLNVVSTGSGIYPFHGGRDSFINRWRVLNPPETRRRIDANQNYRKRVIDTVLDVVRDDGYTPTTTSFRSFFNLQPEDFPHAVDHEVYAYAEYNSRLAEYFQEELLDICPIRCIDGVNHLAMEEIAVGFAKRAGWNNVAALCPLPRHGTTGFVARAQEPLRNLCIVYCPG